MDLEATERTTITSRIRSSRTVFSTDWFKLVAREIEGTGTGAAPHYCLEMPDYVGVVALTQHDEVLLVRQYRAAVDRYTLELPAGHVDQGESPEEAARRELLEETGYAASSVELLGCLAPDTGRLSNRQWTFMARQCAFVAPSNELEISLVKVEVPQFLRLIETLQLDNAPHMAAVLLAILQRRITL